MGFYTKMPIDKEAKMPIDKEAKMPIDREAKMPIGEEDKMPIDREVKMPIDKEAKIQDSELCKYIKDNTVSISGIIFVDGDNASDCLQYLQQSIESSPTNSRFLLVIFVLGKYLTPSKHIITNMSPYTFIIRTLTSAKAATDVVVIRLVDQIHRILSAYLSIPFAICTRDNFGEELCMGLAMENRWATLVKSHDELDIWTKNIHTEPILQKKITSVPMVTNTVPKNDEALRELYVKYWTKTHAQFCRTFNVEATNFLSWRRRKRYNDKNSRNAVRRFLIETQHFVDFE
ncbi:MAG: hypothetical protein KAS12_01790 [Candidatus Aenigmarchaeota archaeon]|nr:hypothetical protein [Candidatus Aenigmarchaeota archaeon]